MKHVLISAVACIGLLAIPGYVSPQEPPAPKEDAGETAKGPASSNLVDEVLAIDEGKNIYEEIGGEEQPEAKGRRSRKDKREKHFFWE